MRPSSSQSLLQHGLRMLALAEIVVDFLNCRGLPRSLHLRVPGFPSGFGLHPAGLNHSPNRPKVTRVFSIYLRHCGKRVLGGNEYLAPNSLRLHRISFRTRFQIRLRGSYPNLNDSSAYRAIPPAPGERRQFLQEFPQNLITGKGISLSKNC
jgi:hypothetical protein